MNLPSELYATLSSLCDGRAYPDATPDNPTYPLIVYQQVGGKAIDFGEKALPDHDHARVQVVVWSKSRIEADTIIRQAREAIISKAWPSETYGAPVSIPHENLKLYGSRQDFGCWYKPD